MDLKGKVAIVTGVSKGIGKATVEQLLTKGCKVVGLGRTNTLPETENYRFIACDVRKYDQVEAAISAAQSAFGQQVHILINNAGLGYFGKIEDHTLDQWHQMYETNVNGIFYLCKLVVPKMKAVGFGHIINIASVAGIEGYPEVSGYCGTKFAVRGISEAMYKELRDDKIKVTCVYPGSVKTDFFANSPGIQPHDYMLMPNDVASMLVWSLETPDNFHQVNLEVRPLQPKGPKK
jgi:NADP-dependent 3-hydroxy acid dehydrogenase YdfG